MLNMVAMCISDYPLDVAGDFHRYNWQILVMCRFAPHCYLYGFQGKVLCCFITEFKLFAELRRAVRSSLVQSTSKHHEHVFPTDSEVYDPTSDTWTKTCSECGYRLTFEKM